MIPPDVVHGWTSGPLSHGQDGFHIVPPEHKVQEFIFPQQHEINFPGEAEQGDTPIIDTHAPTL